MRRAEALRPRAPVPPEVRVGRRLSHDPLRRLPEAARHGDVVRVRSDHETGYLLSHPDHVRHVLLERQADYTKQTPTYGRLREVLGTGMLAGDGEEWRARRRLIQPAFHRGVIDGYSGIMVQEARALADRLVRFASTGAAVDMSAELTRATFGILSRSFFGCEPEPLLDDVRRLCAVLDEHVNTVEALPRPAAAAASRRRRRVTSALARKLDGLIARARDGGAPHGGFLSMLAHAQRPDSGAPMDGSQLREELMTLCLAGHETGAATLSWTFYLLACHPEVDARLREELDSVLGGRAPEPADMARLSYARMVLNEAMRLYPPVWLLTRRAEREDEVGGFRIPRGANVLISPWVTHRLPAFWERPDEFLPERFASGQVAALPRFAYFPFLGGPRQCIGGYMADLEALLILATVVSRVRYRLFPLIQVRPRPSVVLRPAPGPYLMIKAV